MATKHSRHAPAVIALGISAFALTGCVTTPGVMDYAGDLYGTSRYDSRSSAGVYPSGPYPYGYRADPYGFPYGSQYQSGYSARGYYYGYPQRYFPGDPYVTRRFYHEHLRYNCPHPSHRDERAHNDRDRHDGPRDQRDQHDPRDRRDRTGELAGVNPGDRPGNAANLRPPPGLEPGQDNLRPRFPLQTPPKHSRSVLQPVPKASPPATPAAGMVQPAAPAPKPAAAAPRADSSVRTGRAAMREVLERIK
jgi:hypothetical protein